MLSLARKQGITLFDTAADYGNSQRRLGEIAKPSAPKKYVTKFSLPSSDEQPTSDNVYRNSMRELRVENLHGVLFHKLADLKDPRCPATVEVLREGRESDVISRAGVSVYNNRDLEEALQVFPDLDIVQLPANILDLELLHSAPVKELVSRGVEIHVRSVFLQGILLAKPEDLPEYFDSLKNVLFRLHEISHNTGHSVLELVLGKMRKQTEIEAVLVGATTVRELEEITSAWSASEVIEDFELPQVPRELLDPRNWPQIRMNV